MTPTSVPPMHALVVGGTGMLAGVSEELCRRGFATSVVARRTSRLKALAERASGPGRIYPLPVDYHETPALAEALLSSERTLGRIAVCVLWVHDTASDAIECIARIAGRGRRQGSSVPFLHVLSSATVNPLRLADRWKHLRSREGILYRQVLLGRTYDGAHRRWLTHAEISAGVLRALDAAEVVSVVGELPPATPGPVPAGSADE